MYSSHGLRVLFARVFAGNCGCKAHKKDQFVITKCREKLVCVMRSADQMAKLKYDKILESSCNLSSIIELPNQRTSHVV